MTGGSRATPIQADYGISKAKSHHQEGRGNPIFAPSAIMQKAAKKGKMGNR